MTPVAVGTFVAVLAWIGLAVGLIVFFVVILLLNGVLTPLRKVLGDVKSARTAPMLEHGVRGTDQLSQTQQLASSVPDLAGAYLRKLGHPVDTGVRGEIFPDPGSPPGRGGFR